MEQIAASWARDFGWTSQQDLPRYIGPHSDDGSTIPRRSAEMTLFRPAHAPISPRKRQHEQESGEVPRMEVKGYGAAPQS